MKKVKILKEECVFNNFFIIDKALLSFEKFDGEMSNVVERLNFKRGDAVASILVNETTGRVLLVNQFRYPVYNKDGGWIREIVAGMIDEKKETPIDAIKREIIEETGYDVKKIDYLTTFYSSPGGCSERIHLYISYLEEKDKIYYGGGVKSEDEDIMTEEYNIEDLDKMLLDGEIKDAKTIIAILWYKYFINNKK